MAAKTTLQSRETQHLKRSIMRDLLAVAIGPSVISLAGGLPASELLPLEAFRRCLDEALQRDGAHALQYSPPYRPLQEWIASMMGARGVACSPEQVFITNGAQQGIALLSRLFLNPGDPAAIEAVTFTGVQQVTAGRGAELRLVETDLESGVDLESLEAALQRQPRPRLAILIPDFHNPLGVSLTAEKRRQAASLAAQYGVPLVEDDPYSWLRFAGDPLPPIAAYDQDGIVYYVGSFSKSLAPAVRLGWIVAPQTAIPAITVLRESIDLETSSLMQRAVATFLLAAQFEPHLNRLNSANRTRCRALLAALETQLGDLATWTEPDGGLFVWLTLPEQIDTWEMFPRALEHKVAYIPGSAFAVRGDHRHCMRLNFSNLAPEAIEEGVARLVAVVRAHLD